MRSTRVVVLLLSLVGLAALQLPSSVAFPVLRRHSSTFLHDAGASPIADEPAVAQWISQPVDHFASDPSSSPRFMQRYYVNSSLWTPGGPVFLSLGGEGPESPAAVSGHSGLSYYAAAFGAMMVAAEHRYYGESVPDGGNVSTASLRFLTSQQALADFAALIVNLTDTLALPSDTRWVSFGCSYSGSLSAWLKLQYPAAVVGAIASSAPVRAQLDFPDYLRGVERSLGGACSAVLREATRLAETMMETPAQRVYLGRIFPTCDAIDSEKDRSMFFNNLLVPIAALVQYNTNWRSINISSACSDMMAEAQRSNALVALAAFNQRYNTADNGSLPFAAGPDCQNASYSSYLQSMQLNSADRQWYWQTCVEFGFFQSAEGNRSAFSTRYLSYSFLAAQCNDLFGIPVTALPAHVAATNAQYQADHPRTNNTVFTNGLIDPWHVVSITNGSTGLTGNGLRVDLIGPTSHCQDLAFPRPSDIAALVQARWSNIVSINQWLGLAPLPSSTGGGGGGGGGAGSASSSSSSGRGRTGSSSASAGGGSGASSTGGATGDDGGGGSRSGSMSGGALVGIVVFLLVMAAAGGVGGYWYWKRRRAAAGGSGGGGGGFDRDIVTTGYSSLLGGDGRSTT